MITTVEMANTIQRRGICSTTSQPIPPNFSAWIQTDQCIVKHNTSESAHAVVDETFTSTSHFCKYPRLDESVEDDWDYIRYMQTMVLLSKNIPLPGSSTGRLGADTFHFGLPWWGGRAV